MNTIGATVSTRPITATVGEGSGGGGKGDPGDSAYEIWLSLGNTGTEQDFIDSLKGEQGEPGKPGKPGDNGDAGSDGESVHQLWLKHGGLGTEQDFLQSLHGEPGEPGTSAYQEWLDAGNEGTREEFLESLKGRDGDSGIHVGDGIPNRHPRYDGEVWRDTSRNFNIGTWVGDGTKWVPGVGAYTEQIESDYGTLYLTMAGDTVTFRMAAFRQDGSPVVDLLVPLPAWVITPPEVSVTFISAYVPDGLYYKEIPAKVLTGKLAGLSVPGTYATVDIAGDVDLATGEFHAYMLNPPEPESGENN